MKKQSKENRKYWENHVKNWQKSGLSKRAYIRMENISYWTFRDKIKQQKDEDGSKKIIKVPKEKYPHLENNESGIEIRLRDKITIQIKRGFDGEVLRNLLNELGAAE